VNLPTFERYAKGAVWLALFALVVALTILVVSTVSFVSTSEKVVAQLPYQIDRQADATRVVALSAITDTRQEALAEIANIHKDVISKVDSLSATANQQVTDTRTQLLGEVDEIRKTADNRIGDTLAQVDTLIKKLSPILTNAAEITGHVSSVTAHVDDALPQFTDCAYLDASGEPVGGNPDCVFNRFQGVSKAFEQMAQAGAKAAPQVSQAVAGIATNFDGITADVHTATTDFNKPKTTWQKFKSWLDTAGKLAAHFL
jgi:hypothetical protein